MMDLRTSRVVIYAVGGGHGHALRGINLARRISSTTLEVEVIIRAGALDGVSSVGPFGNSIKVSSDYRNGYPEGRGATLIVDTFVYGWNNQISESWFTTFDQRIFLARYRRDINWPLVERMYDKIWLPYEQDHNEWADFPNAANCIGLLVRKSPYLFRSVVGSFVLIDTEKRCSDGFCARLADLAERSGLTFSRYTRIPPELSAEKFLIIGGGYNTFYELLSSKADIRFLPLKKRFDDQHQRVRLYGMGVESFRHISDWFSQGSSPSLYSLCVKKNHKEDSEYGEGGVLMIPGNKELLDYSGAT